MRKTRAALIVLLALFMQPPMAGFADESAKNAKDFATAAEADADWLGAGGDPSKMAYSDLGKGTAVARLKDIATIQGVRENQLVGYGLVIGLKGTGDSLRNSPFTEQSMRAMLDNLGISAPRNATRSQNTAAVIVTANLPAFAGAGSRIDVTVSSLGDASSLQGGTLVMTPLMGADNQVYAVAQGNMIVSGFAAEGEAANVTQGVPTSGRIPNGALVEREVAGNFGKEGELVVELRDPDFTTAIRVADTINIFAQRRYGRGVARERDAKTIRLVKPKNITAARFLAELEGLPIATDEVARVVVDERTGTVVIGEKVRISKVAISHGSLTVRVTETPMVVQPEPFSDGITGVEPNTDIAVNQPDARIGILTGANLEKSGEGAEPDRRQADRDHRDPSGDQDIRRSSRGTGGAMTMTGQLIRYTSALALFLGAIAPGFAQETAAPASAPPGNLDEIRKFCGNIDDKAADARYALQARQLAELKADVETRMRALEEKRKEYETWLKRRDEFVSKAQDSLVDIVSRMKPDAAAAQMALIGDEAAAALLLKLNPRVSSIILNEMPPEKAAKLARVIVGAQRTGTGGADRRVQAETGHKVQ